MVLLTVVVITWLQVHFLGIRVVETEVWPERATFLKSDAGWNYGYVHGIHGAILIRASASPAVGEARTAEEDGYSSEYRKERDDYMLAELAALRSLAIYEGLFYLSWVLLLRFALPPTFRKLAGAAPSPRRKARAMAVMTGLAMGYLLLPRIAAGYGCSAYSTWAGPYAMSSSGPYLPPTLWPGETISYRPVLEIALLPMVAVVRSGGWLPPLLLSAFYGWLVVRVGSVVRRMLGKATKRGSLSPAAPSSRGVE